MRAWETFKPVHANRRSCTERGLHYVNCLRVCVLYAYKTPKKHRRLDILLWIIISIKRRSYLSCYVAKSSQWCSLDDINGLHRHLCDWHLINFCMSDTCVCSRSRHSLGFRLHSSAAIFKLYCKISY